ncbi:MAG: hypothetical protein ACM3ZQ_01675 [Bacillota bacterium]
MAKFTAWEATCPNLASDLCPCLLADFRACPNCSHLAGYPLCACDWRGFCPFLERQWSNPQPVRVGQLPRVVASSQSAPGLLELAVTVGDRRLEPYALPGTVARLGLQQLPSARLHPIAIVADIDLRLRAVLLAVSLVHPENMLFGEADAIWLDPNPGNMLWGAGRLAEQAQGSVLIIASGIGQAALVSVIRALLQRGNAVTTVIAPGKVGAGYMVGRVQSLGTAVHSVESLYGPGRDLTKRLVREQPFDLVVSLGGEDQNQWLGEILADTRSMLPVVACDTYRYSFISE